MAVKTSTSRKGLSSAQSTIQKKKAVASPSGDKEKTDAKIKTTSEKTQNFVALKEIFLTPEQNMRTGAVGPDATTKKATAFMGEKDVPVGEVFKKLGWERIKEDGQKMNYWAENAVLIARVSRVSYRADHNGKKKVANIVEFDYLLNKTQQTESSVCMSSTVSAFRYNRAAAEAVKDDDILILCIDKKHLTREQMRLILE